MHRKTIGFLMAVWSTSCAPVESRGRLDAETGLVEAGGLDGGTTDTGVGADAGVGIDVDVSADGDVNEDAQPEASVPSACEPACPRERAQCSLDGACKPCSEDAHCAAFPDAPTCIDGVCVACRENRDCKDPAASVCNLTTHTCQACEAEAGETMPSDADCQDLAGTPVCRAGTCVQCTGQRRAACDADVCNALTHTCEAGKTEHSANVCEPCVSDAQCQVGQVCAVMSQEHGAFCLPLLSTSCENQRPYAKEVTDGESLDGLRQPYCTLSYATCAAMRQDGHGYRSNCGVNDAGMPVASAAVRGENDLCGAPDIDDGFCVKAGTGQFKCTVPCGNGSEAGAVDCPNIAGPNDPTCASQMHESGSDLLCTP